jgi:NifU-like protein involved in Fe-S cluster formation
MFPPCVFCHTRYQSVVSNFEENVRKALSQPQNQGEMTDADSVGTVGSPDCGDMLRMWLKFTEKDGKKVIDRATFQSFGCQTAIAVASMATELLKGKTIEQARALSADELSGDLGALPPMKIHCGQLVEGALRSALDGGAVETKPAVSTLSDDMKQPAGKVKINFLPPA